MAVEMCYNTVSSYQCRVLTCIWGTCKLVDVLFLLSRDVTACRDLDEDEVSLSKQASVKCVFEV